MANVPIQTGAAPQSGAVVPDPSLVKLTHAVYGLYAASFFLGITAIVAIVIDYVKRDDARGTFLESHFRWQIRTFWIALLWGAIGGILILAVVGIPVLIAGGIWCIYRIVKGWLALFDRKPVGVPV
ncbi:MAG: hypothetical protein M1550_02545 [Deltaproteobacteria bacterium]|nr:hypothetical protein [Deltaproteobacteria bacterium]